MLALRGVDPSACDDLIQEVAVRALAVELPFDSADDLYAWAAPVARNLHIDLIRATGRTTAGDSLVGLPAAIDVEHEVERRMVLQSALQALASLGEADRAARHG
jgi:DNA-directed RNA polymerase specialized sigma24 family protein